MKLRLLSAAALAATAAPPAFACSSCRCTLASDWLSQGLVALPGTTIGLRYDYIPQTVLRSGTRRVDRAAIAFPTDREIERYTYNHYITASIDRQFDSHWGLNVELPFIDRPHATIAEGDTDISTSRTNGIGDLRVTARWQDGGAGGAIDGFQVGLRLPTGRFHQTFHTGPQTGEEVDRGLQPGYGTVGVTAGYYRYGALGTSFGYIVQAQGEAPLDSRDEYKPGLAGQASAALHYTRWQGITPELQIAFRASAKDHGLNADRPNSGGEQLNLSPGLLAGFGARTAAFVYVQVPVYQHVNGYQITPRATLSVGLRYRL